MKCVQNEGMPLYRDPYERGQLLIQFTVRHRFVALHLLTRPLIPMTLINFIVQVEFPEKHWLPEHLMYQLERLLPPREDVMITDDMEEVELTVPDVRTQQKAYGGEAYEEDDDGGPRGCQSQ